MVALLPKTIINNLRIDTVERAIVFAALALRAAIIGTDNSNSKSRDVTLNIRINRDNTANLDIDISLAFNGYDFYVQAGNLIDNIINFDTVSIDLESQFNFTVSPTLPSIPRIPDYDETKIDSFEKYFLYYIFVLLASIEDKNNKVIQISFLQGIPGNAKIKIDCAIPIDLNNWLLGDNYINSVLRVVDSYQAPTITPIINPEPSTGNTLGLLTNSDLLTNEQLLINQIVNSNLLTNEQLLTNNNILTN